MIGIRDANMWEGEIGGLRPLSPPMVIKLKILKAIRMVWYGQDSAHTIVYNKNLEFWKGWLAGMAGVAGVACWRVVVGEQTHGVRAVGRVKGKEKEVDGASCFFFVKMYIPT